MSRYAAFLLLLAIVPWNFCAADPDYQEYDPTDVSPTVKPSTAATSKPTTPTETTTTTTPAAPTTPKTTSAAPTPPKTTSAAPTTAKTTSAPPTPPKTTSAAPTTPKTTTVAPTTSTTTTAAPNTTATTAPAPTTPPPTPDPVAKVYEVKKGNDTCLMVKFGLRVAHRGEKYEEMNLEPNNTVVASGVCAEDNSTLVLKSDNLTLSFIFHNDTKKFNLFSLSVNGNLSTGTPVSESNNTLSLWQASITSSYMCNKQQSSNITAKLTIFTVDLQVQPFGIKNNKFSTAEECFLDSDLSFLVPIAVGVALSFLIILVLISYLIGRRKSRTGYQSV